MHVVIVIGVAGVPSSRPLLFPRLDEMMTGVIGENDRCVLRPQNVFFAMKGVQKLHEMITVTMMATTR